MKFTYFAVSKSREMVLGYRLKVGAEKRGHSFRVASSEDWNENGTLDRNLDFDVGLSYGATDRTKSLMKWCRKNGKGFIYLDKPFCVRQQYVKVSVGGFQPIPYVDKARKPPDRLEEFVARRLLKLPTEIKPRGSSICWAPPTAKFCRFHDLGDPEEITKKVLDGIRRIAPNRQVIYRPRTTLESEQMRPRLGMEFSDGNQSMNKDLVEKCYAVVVWGSNLGLGMLLEGVPVITLGGNLGITGPVTPHGLEVLDSQSQWNWDVEKIVQWMRNVVYCQWTLEEMTDSKFWLEIEEQLEWKERS